MNPLQTNAVRHEVLISNPRVTNGKMLLMLHIKDWHEHECFYYPLDDIDCKSVYIHVLWKMAGDERVTVRTTAELDVEQEDPHMLNIRNWGFHEAL
jgi:hypothetical protein